MKLINYVMFFLVLAVGSYVQAKEPSIEDFISQPSEDLFFSNLTPQEEVEVNVVDRLISGLQMSEEKAKEAHVQRLLTSDLFSVRVGERNYLIGPDAKNWVQSDFEGFYMFGDGVRNVTVSNDTRESLLSLQLLLKSVNEYLPHYGDLDSDLVFFAFMDATCPHCRDFHLFSRTDFERAGVSFIYIPFLRDTKSYLGRQTNLRAYCAPSKLDIKQRLNKTFSLSVTELEADLSNPNCTKIQLALFEFLLGSGDRYNLRGSPMFMSFNGDVIYGVPSLKRYVFEKQSKINK